MLGPRGVGGDEGKVDVCRRRTRQLALGLLGGFPQALDSELVSRQVDARVGLELLHEVLQESVVKVLASQESVPVGGLDLKDAAAHLEDGDVERASSEVVDCEEALLLVGAVGEGRGGGLVADALDVEAGDASGVFLRGIPRVFEKERRGRGKGNDEPRGRKKRGVKEKLSRFALSLSSLSLTFRRLPLRVVEVGRDRHHRLSHAPAEVRLGRLLHLDQRERANLARGVLVPPGLDPRVAVVRPDDLVRDHLGFLLGLRVVERAADEALRGVDRVRRVGDALPLGGQADEALALVGEGDDGGSGAGSLGVLDDLGGLKGGGRERGRDGGRERREEERGKS